jgi:hypothetical protein
MTINRGTWTAAAVSLLLLTTAGCAGPGGAAPTPVAAGSSGAAAPVTPVAVRIEQVGGFMGEARAAVRVPMVSIYPDGRVITQGPVLMIYPGPALTPLLVRKISPAAVQTLIGKATAAGVRNGAELGRPGIADASTTRFTVTTAGGTQTTDAYALTEGAGSDMSALSADQQAARKKLAELVQQLTDLSATLGADQVGPEQPYRPQALAALAGPWEKPQEDGVTPPPAQEWTGPALPGEPVSPGGALGCTTVAGAQLDGMWETVQKAKQTTPWTWGGKPWGVSFRPMLPDETGCDTLRNS